MGLGDAGKAGALSGHPGEIRTPPRATGSAARGSAGGREGAKRGGPWEREEGYTEPMVILAEAGGPGGGVPKGVRRVRGRVLGVNGMGGRIP